MPSPDDSAPLLGGDAPAENAQRSDQTVPGSAVCLLRRLEPPHGPLSLACGLVGVLGPIVEALMLAVVDLQLQLFYGGTVALEFVGHYDARGVLHPC